MRQGKKFLSILIAAVMVIAMAIPVSATGTTDNGNGSIKITNATKGQTYKAYKIFDVTANGSAVAYTTDAAGKSVIESYNEENEALFEVAETADVNGKYNVTKKSTATNEKIIAWVSENYSSFDSTGKDGIFDATGSTCTISELDLGYYYVKSSLGSVISLDTVTGANKEIKDKNTQGPNTPDKNITAEDSVDITKGKENGAKVGSKETFEITYNATNWVTTGEGDNVTTTQVKNFYIKDTPTGLNIDSTSVKVTVNGGATNADYAPTVNVDSTTGVLTITIPWVDADNNSLYTPSVTQNANIPVVVTYDVTITSAAATAVAENEAQIYYNHDSSSSTDGVEVTIPKNPPKTQTYTYKFQLNKTDGTNALAGAKFELYDGSTKVNLVANGATYRVAGTGEGDNVTTTIDMTTNTTVEITGLDNKNYTLKEIEAPDGYTLAADTTIGATGSTEANKLVRVDATTYNDSGSGKITVVNVAGSSLPTTGGMGTVIFYVVGAILVVGAGVMLVVRRRMNAR